MSERADFIVVAGGTVEVFHHRWGAGIVLETLLGGPEASLTCARSGEASAEISDVLAGVVIDVDRRTLALAGEARTLGGGGFVGRRLDTPPQRLLAELATAWPGWTLFYEPDYVLEPLALYVRNLGLPLASLNEPHRATDALGKARWQGFALKHEADAPGAPAERPAGGPIGRETLVRELDLDAFSFRAANELSGAGLVLVGDVIGLDQAALARLGVGAQTRAELEETLAGGGLALGTPLPEAWPAWRAEVTAGAGGSA